MSGPPAAIVALLIYLGVAAIGWLAVVAISQRVRVRWLARMKRHGWTNLIFRSLIMLGAVLTGVGLTKANGTAVGYLLSVVILFGFGGLGVWWWIAWAKAQVPDEWEAMSAGE